MSFKGTNKYVVAIAGPTAVGKTAIALQLALHFRTEILSADSRQMYRHMDIGTAKPTCSELQQVRHHFIDSLDISRTYSAGDFERDALDLLDQLFVEHDIVILAGGSGLYLHALLDGFDELPFVDNAISVKWENAYREKGLDYLQRRIQQLDPDYAGQVDMQNHRRLTRALAVIEQTGVRFSEFLKQRKPEREFTPIRIFLNLPRQQLYDRIDERVNQMIDTGLEEEVRNLLKFRDMRAMESVGYQEFLKYFDGDWTKEETISKIKQHSRNYAKRQVTWFRNQGDWWECNPPDFRACLSYITEQTQSSRNDLDS